MQHTRVVLLGAPPAEVEIDEALVRRLLRQQHPDLAKLPLRQVAHGWDNVMFRLGDALCVRLPRRALGAELILSEQRWLPILARSLPIPVPAPVRLGRPGHGYPWTWSVVPWLPGETLDGVALRPGEALRFAEFLIALHTPAPADAPRSAFRGMPLQERADDIGQRIMDLSSERHGVSDSASALFDAALAAPESEASLWLHGDLHARNLLALDGRITAVIDWGDMCAGDPATDVAGFWLLFDDPREREAGLRRYLAARDRPGLRARALGWAVAFATLLLHATREAPDEDDPHRRMGRAILQRLQGASGAL